MFRNALIALAGILVGALIVTLTLAGHATASASPAPDVTSPVTSAVAMPTAAPTEVRVGDPYTIADTLTDSPAGQAMITTVRPKLRFYNEGGSDRDLVALGVTICQAFDRGQPFTQLMTFGPSSGFTQSETASMIGAAVGALCPEHLGELHL
jgi:hypothetical protein